MLSIGIGSVPPRGPDRWLVRHLTTPHMTRRHKLVLTITAGVLLCAVAVLAFFQGMFYANRKATITLANDGCFYTVQALRTIKDPKQARIALLFDTDMDSFASKLAEMCLKYPREIKRTHYNVLVRVRDYRKQYGRDPQRADDTDYLGVDKKVDEAIAYLESIHNMKDWVPYKFDLERGKVKAE